MSSLNFIPSPLKVPGGEMQAGRNLLRRNTFDLFQEAAVSNTYFLVGCFSKF